MTGAKVQGNKIAVEVEISPKWDLPEAEKAASPEMWIRSKTRTVFRVTAIK